VAPPTPTTQTSIILMDVGRTPVLHGDLHCALQGVPKPILEAAHNGWHPGVAAVFPHHFAVDIAGGVSASLCSIAALQVFDRS